MRGNIVSAYTYLAAPLALFGAATGVLAQESPPAQTGPTYADIADVADAAELVARVQVRKQAVVEPERAPGLQPGFARLYIEARTQALLVGGMPLGESLRYLVDVPLMPDGKAPKLKKQQMLIFARAVPSRPGEVQLVGKRAQMAWSEQLESRVRPILSGLLEADAPPSITGVRDVISVAGNLIGESETQIFLDTRNDGPVSVSVIRRPGMAPVWGVSWTEIVDQAARPPRPATLEWYRLACFLPGSLPAKVNLSRDTESRRRALEDYRFVLDQLGNCPRSGDGNI